LPHDEQLVLQPEPATDGPVPPASAARTPAAVISSQHTPPRPVTVTFVPGGSVKPPRAASELMPSGPWIETLPTDTRPARPSRLLSAGRFDNTSDPAKCETMMKHQ
jgi:hypothetical protein